MVRVFTGVTPALAAVARPLCSQVRIDPNYGQSSHNENEAGSTFRAYKNAKSVTIACEYTTLQQQRRVSWGRIRQCADYLL
jgi:hypothetical protein